MKRTSRTLFVSVFVLALVTFARPAHAETLDLAGILDILESTIFERILPSGTSTANLGGCQVQVSLGFPTTELRFQHVGTCKLEGYVRLGVLPLTASVSLVVYDTPFIDAVDADFTMSLRFRPFTLRWSLTNGRVAFRMTPTSPEAERALTGQGMRSRPSTGFVAEGRFNLFDPTTAQGQALLRTVQNGARSRQVCALSGAVLSDPLAGSLSACVPK